MVLLDMMMSGLDGIETSKVLKKLPECGESPIVFIAAKAQADELEQYILAGAAGAISKPVDPMVLADEDPQIWNEAVPEHSQ